MTYLVPSSVFFSRHATKGRSLVPALNTLILGSNDPAADALTSGLVSVTTELDWIPDWTTFKYLPYAPGHAWVMGTTIDRDTDAPWEFDARNVLRRLLGDLRTTHNLDLVTGSESEFYVYSETTPTGHPVPLDNTVYASPLSLLGTPGRAFDEMIMACQNMGAIVYDSHAEIGGGQYEIATEHDRGERGATALVLTREVVHAGGLRARGQAIRGLMLADDLFFVLVFVVWLAFGLMLGTRVPRLAFWTTLSPRSPRATTSS